MAQYALLRLRNGQEEAEPVTEVNIIPVIDISLVLLVILFVTAPLLSYPNHPIELPRSSVKQSQETTVAITCTREGHLAVAAHDVTWENLTASLEAELKRRPEATVILRVDRAVPYRVVQKLIMASKQAGAKAIALATEPYQ